MLRIWSNRDIKKISPGKLCGDVSTLPSPDSPKNSLNQINRASLSGWHFLVTLAHYAHIQLVVLTCHTQWNLQHDFSSCKMIVDSISKYENSKNLATKKLTPSKKNSEIEFPTKKPLLVLKLRQIPKPRSNLCTNLRNSHTIYFTHTKSEYIKTLKTYKTNSLYTIIHT